MLSVGVKSEFGQIRFSSDFVNRPFPLNKQFFYFSSKESKNIFLS